MSLQSLAIHHVDLPAAPYLLPLQVEVGPGCVLSNLARDALLSNSSLPQLAMLKLFQLTAGSQARCVLSVFMFTSRKGKGSN